MSLQTPYNDRTVIISVIKGELHDFCEYDNYISENLPFRVNNVINQEIKYNVGLV